MAIVRVLMSIFEVKYTNDEYDNGYNIIWLFETVNFRHALMVRNSQEVQYGSHKSSTQWSGEL